jgi:hypothetical protein
MGLHKSAAIAALISCALLGQSAPLSPEDQEEFLRQAKVLTQRYTSKGITLSQRATLSDGRLTHDAHIQRINEAKTSFQTERGVELNFRDTYKFNIAGYRLARLLGLEDMVPVSIERKVAGQSAAVTWWIDDVMMDEGARLKNKLTAPDANRWNKQMNIVRIFDQLIYNTDRNRGNLLIRKDWSLCMIDHTRAFRKHRTLPNPKSLTMCDRVLLGRLRALGGEQLTKAVSPYLEKAEIEAVLARRDAIVALFKTRIEEKGENSVLFDYLPPVESSAR